MGRSSETFSKRDREKKKAKKREEKARKKAERKAQSAQNGPGDMIAYVDENGVIVDTPPDPTKKQEVDIESIAVSVPKTEKIELDPIRKGRVEFFNHDKGFGFILDLETQKEHFAHVKGLIDEITEGDMVTFELEQGPRGMNAVRVKRQ